MAKGQKTSTGKRSDSREDDFALHLSRNAACDDETSLKEKPSNELHEEVASELLDALETKSVAESDSGRLCGDLLSNVVSPKGKENVYNEPPLSDIIVSRYEGEKTRSGQFEGHGHAWFIGGNSYEGNFLNGVMHGKGKYLWQDEVQYEGDMNNNQISGYGRYQWPDKSYYEGEIIDGLRHGVGVFKSPQFNVSYSGQWYLGKRHGRGIMHYSEHSWYEGDWVNNTRHGWGVRRYHTGNVYEGQWVNDKRHGEGTMRWLTSDESFSGMWENGVQHGCGTHTWYLNRVPGSQYPLRNEYVGDFINGLRHGHGKFFFASGAVYNGEWENNKKHGWGKFIFKNGKVFEGQFENDHMVEHPEFRLDGNENLDASEIRTRAPFDWKEAQEEGDGSLLGTGLSLDIDSILDDFKENEPEKELKEVTLLMLRNLSILRRVYSFYSALGHDRSPDNTFVMTRFQFWRFLKDCRIHHHSYSLSAMDRAIAKCHAGDDVHNPMEKLLLREFLTACVVLSYIIYKKEATSDSNKKKAVLSGCLQRLIDEHILRYSCRVGGHFLFEPRRAVNALAFMDRSWHIYQRACTPAKQPPHEPRLSMRTFLFLLKDLKVISPQLSTRAVLNILSSDDPSVFDGETCNMEVEMTFLEFFEALIGIAVNFVSDDMLQSSFMGEHPRDRMSRPASSVSQTVSEQGATNPAMSTDTFSQIDDERMEVGRQHASKQSVVSHAGGGSTGAFLHTLSQMSMQEDRTHVAEDNASIAHEDLHSHAAAPSEDVHPGETEFTVWSNKLNKFFSQHFFPSWDHLEASKAEASKMKAENEENARLKSLELEAQRRRQMVSEESIEQPIPEPEVSSIPNATECSSAGNGFLAVDASDVPRVTSSTASVPSSTKSGKVKKKK